MRLPRLIVPTLLTLLSTACSGGSPAATTSAAGTPSAATPSAPAAAAVIDQRDLQFVPATVTVKVGEVVLITSSDSPLHNVRIDSTTVAATMKKGDSVRWTAPAPGEYKMTCDYHPAMLATIVVTR